MSHGLKRLLTAALCVALLSSLSACGGDAHRCTLRFSAIASTGDGSSVGSYINSLTLSERRMAAYKELLDTDTFRERLSEACGGFPTSTQLEKMVEYTLEEDLGIVEVTVTARSRDTAETVSKAFSRLAPEFLSELQSNASFQLIEERSEAYPLSWRSTQRLYVNNHAASSGDVRLSASDLQASVSLADTVTMISKSRSFLDELADTCNSSLSYEELKSLISVDRVDETEVLEIKITYTDRALVERLSSAFSSVLDEKLQAIVDGTSVSDVDRPQIEAYPAY